ncbi:MAG: cytochrome c, partial [Gemmatimonadaceae bacterium]
MATWKRRIGITLGGLIGLIVLAIAGFYAVATFKLNREHQIGAAVTPPIPTDSAAIARGHVFADLHGCTGCHAGNLAGQVMVDQFPLGRLAAPNLTRGKGGIGSLYTDAEWERAIRHGVRRNGRALLMMPSESFSKLRDDDVAALIAYVKSVPPVDNELPSRRIYPVAAALVALGPFTPAAERIDHAARSTGPEPGVTVAYG